MISTGLPGSGCWFAAIEMIRLAGDQEWLQKATKEIAKYQKRKKNGIVFLRFRGNRGRQQRLFQVRDV